MSTTTTTTQTSSNTHIQPRRRAAATGPHLTTTLPQSKPSCPSPTDMPFRKGSTFHSPKDPPSPSQDPILNIKNLPLRSLTSPEALQDLCDESDKRVADLLASFNRNLSGLGSSLETDYEHQDALPVHKGLAANAAPKTSLTDDGHHQVTGNKASNRIGGPKYSVYTSTKRRDEVDETYNHTTSHVLSEYAAKVIKLHVIDPILKEEDLKSFHSLVKSIPQRISSKQITCLRDLEKTLIFLAPVSTPIDISQGEGVLAHLFPTAKTRARSPASYLDFCEVSIQCIHTTVDHLNEIDQRRPTDRPYTNNYFVDLVEQVRAYARIMARTRAKKAKGVPLDESDIQPGEKLTFRGGVSEDGKPAELVRERDGTIVAIEEGHIDADGDEDMLDTEVMRSMARKRKCDIGKVEYHACRECGKVYTRPCDLTKHEKTHSRPWKCPHTDCKYYELGWPTEKERDRHTNDKHSSAPALYRCLFQPCTYTSKRESNCKQHMEKAHGWDYVRSKSRKGAKLIPTAGSPTTQLMPTPASERLSTPAFTNDQSPAASSYQSFSPAASGFGSTRGSISSGHVSTGFASPAPGGPSYEFGKDSYVNNGYISPSMSEGYLAAENHAFTPNSTGSGVDAAALNTNFEDNFNFNDLTYNWGTMHVIFPQYHIPEQQPTPASDFNYDFGTEEQRGIKPQPELSPHGHAAGDSMLFAPETGVNHPCESQGYVEFAAQAKAGSANDFMLFGEIPSGRQADATALFGDVNLGMAGAGLDAGEFSGDLPVDGDVTMGMFDDMSEEEMDRYLYGDGSPIGAGSGEL